MTRPADTRPAFTVRQALACGALWGIIVSVIEASNQASRTLSLGDYERLLTSLLMTYAPSGALWSLMLLWLDRAGLRRGRLVLAIIASIALNAVLNVSITHLEGRFGLAQGMADMLGAPPQIDSQILHVLWINAFFGGLYSVGFVLHQRSVRQRLALRDVEILRSQSEGLLRQAELDRLRTQSQPRLLVEVLSELRRRYAAPSRRSERLLDMTVGFLRSARSSLQAPQSSLRRELAMARGYFDLCDAIAFMGRRWRLSTQAPAPDIGFPSLILLALVEPLARAAPDGSEIALRGERSSDGGYLLRLTSVPQAEPGWLTPELEFRLRTSLRAAGDDAVELLLDASGHAPGDALGLLINAPGVGGRDASALEASSHNREVQA